MPVFYDQMGRRVILPVSPSRIISLVPSQTELLFDLGLEQQIQGITRFCIHPAGKVKSLSKVGGTKKLDIALIHQLKPDLIIANKEENSRSEIELLMKEYPVWMSDIITLQDACNMITGIGDLTAKAVQAAIIRENISKEFNRLAAKSKSSPGLLSVAYFIWKKPYMVAAANTFINEMLKCAGLRNAFSEAERYPVLEEEDIRQARPDVIFLSSEPYPFNKTHIEEFKRICPDAAILPVDGEPFSWYGSRLQSTPRYLEALLEKLKNIT